MPTFVAEATTAPGVVSATTATLPTGWQAGDKVYVLITGKASSSATVIPQLTVAQGANAWTYVGFVGPAGGGSVGNDAGPVHIFVYERTMAGGETAPTVTPGATGFNSWEFVTSAWRPSAGNTWKFADGATPVAFAADTSATAPLTGTTAALSTAPTAGDAILTVGAVPTDAGTAISARAITATGLSGGTVAATGSSYIANPVGSDSAGMSGRWEGFTGTATSGVTVSFTITGATNNLGAVGAILVADQASSGGTSKTLTDTASAADSLSVTVARPLADTASAADSASAAAAGQNVSPADTASGVDSVALAAAAALADTAGAGDTLTRTVSVVLTDTAAAADSASVSVGAVDKAPADTVAAVDSLTVSITIGLTDTATAADSANAVASQVTFKAAGTPYNSGSANTTSITWNKPAGTVAGDLIVLYATGNVGSAAPTTPNGFTAGPSSVATVCVAVFYRVADGSEGNTFTSTVPSGKWHGFSAIYGGVDTSSPEDATFTTANTATAPAITTSTDNAMVVVVGRATTASGVTNTTWSSTNSTIPTNGSATGTFGAAVNNTGAFAYALRATAGTFTPTLTATGTNTAERRLTMALRPGLASGAVAQSLADSAAGEDGLNADATAPLADTATALDVLSVAVAGQNIGASDTAVAGDAAQIAVAAQAAENASGSDALVVSVLGAPADTAGAADALTRAATAALADTAAAVDAVSVSQGTNKALTDTASVADVAQVTVSVTLADTATRSESASVSIGVTFKALADTAAASDAVALAAAMQPAADNANAGESITASVTVNLSDAANAQDTVSVGAGQNVTPADAATAADALTVSVPVVMADTATGSDAISRTVALVFGDTASGVDIAQIAATAAMGDLANAIDNAYRAGQRTERPDTGTTFKPTGGRTAQPGGGTTVRGSGRTVRPFTGTTIRA